MNILKKAAPLARIQPKQNGSTKSIPRGIENVNNTLRRLRLITGLSAGTLVKQVQHIYPKYDKHLHSKCERTEEYGITLCEDGLNLLINSYAPGMSKTAPVPPRRRNPCLVSCRLTKAEFEQLQLVIRAKGYDSMQAFLSKVLRGYIRRYEKE
jgi:hypothetical protein